MLFQEDGPKSFKVLRGIHEVCIVCTHQPQTKYCMTQLCVFHIPRQPSDSQAIRGPQPGGITGGALRHLQAHGLLVVPGQTLHDLLWLHQT